MIHVPPLYALDTNIFVHFVIQSQTWNHIRATYNLFVQPLTPVYSVVTVGEMNALALRRSWGSNKMQQMEYALLSFEMDSIADAVIEKYAEIDFFLRRTGGTIGQNDMWIAATAVVNGCILLTTDHDFLRLQPAGLLCHVIPTIKKP